MPSAFLNIMSHPYLLCQSFPAPTQSSEQKPSGPILKVEIELTRGFHCERSQSLFSGKLDPPRPPLRNGRGGGSCGGIWVYPGPLKSSSTLGRFLPPVSGPSWGPKSNFSHSACSQQLSRKSCSCLDATSLSSLTLKWPHHCSIFRAPPTHMAHHFRLQNRVACPALPSGESGRMCL